jgi:hypothetical protein
MKFEKISPNPCSNEVRVALGLRFPGAGGFVGHEDYRSRTTAIAGDIVREWDTGKCRYDYYRACPE